jgi:hypothetical protein
MLTETLMGSLGFYYLFLRNKDLSFLCHCIVIITALQSLIVLIMFVSPQVRDIIFQNIFRPDTATSLETLFLRDGGFRGLGLAASVTFDLAILLSIGMMLSSYMIFVKRSAILFYSFAWLINFVAVMMAGRSGLFGVAFSLLILIYAFKNTDALKRAVYFLFGIFLILGIGLICLLAINPKDVMAVFNDKVIAFAFEMFINYSETGQFETHSSNVLKTMYFPISLKTFIVGDGYFMHPHIPGSYYMHTDAGYMRHVLFYGIFPSLILYCSYAFGFLAMVLKTWHNKFFAGVVLLIGGYFFLAQYKGEFFLTTMITKLFFVLFVYVMNSKRRVLYKSNESLLTTS